MNGDASAAAHSDSVDEGHMRSCESMNEMVELIFVDEKVLLEGGVLLTGLVDGADVATGAESFGIVRLKNDHAHVGIAVPFLVGLSHGVDHAKVEGVESLGAVERKQTQTTFVLRNDLRGGGRIWQGGGEDRRAKKFFQKSTFVQIQTLVLVSRLLVLVPTYTPLH